VRLLAGLAPGVTAVAVETGDRRRVVAWHPGGAVGRVGKWESTADFAQWVEAIK
jgi:hypothetical protein